MRSPVTSGRHFPREHPIPGNDPVQGIGKSIDARIVQRLTVTS